MLDEWVTDSCDKAVLGGRGQQGLILAEGPGWLLEEKREENEKHFLNLYEFLLWIYWALILSGVSVPHQEMSTPVVQQSSALNP